MFPCGWVGLSLSVSVQWRGLWHSTIPSSKPPLHCGLVGARLKATWARHLILGQGLQHQTLWQLGAATRAKGTQGQVPFFHLSGWKETIRPNSRRRSGWTLFCLNVLPCIIQAILVEDTKCQDLMKSIMPNRVEWKTESWKMQQVKADSEPRHSTDFRTNFGIMIGWFVFCEIGQTYFTESGGSFEIL